MLKPQTKCRLWVFSPIILILTLCYADALTEAGGTLGIARFHANYRVSVSKQRWLRTYHANLWDHDGGYIPLPIQQFLCSRLENSKDSEEIRAIAEFYGSQARGREYGPLDSLSKAGRIRLISALIETLPAQPFQERVSSLYLVEEVRRDEMMGKGYFFTSDEKRLAAHRRLHPTYQPGHEVEDTAQETLLQWWSAKGLPAEKLKQDPLGQVGLKIDGY